MYIVTGGSGFFGQHLVELLVSKGEAVKGLDVLPPATPVPGATYALTDVTNPQAVAEELCPNDVLIHNAAVVPLARDKKRFWQVNVEGTKAVLKAAEAVGVKKVIFISSSSVFGVPTTSGPITEETPLAPFEEYGKSKAAAEAVCRSFKDRLDISIVRPRTIVGPGRMGILALIFDWVARHRPVIVLGQGRNRYQLIAASDLAEAVYRISTSPACKGEDVNIGTPFFGPLREDLEGFFIKVGSRSRVYGVPGVIARLVLPLLSAVRLVPFVSYQYTVADKDIFFSTEKIERLLNWVPTKSNADMLAEAFLWYKQHPQTGKGGSIHSRGVKRGLLRLLG